MEDEEMENLIKEAKHYYGSWEELRKVIEYLERNEQEANYERYYSHD